MAQICSLSIVYMAGIILDHKWSKFYSPSLRSPFCHWSVGLLCTWGTVMGKTLMIFVVQESSLVNPVVTLCLVAQSCLTLVTPWTVACQAPLSMGILQARILEWVAIPFSRGFSQPRDWTQVSWIADRFFTVWATREDLLYSDASDFCMYGLCILFVVVQVVTLPIRKWIHHHWRINSG